jgi:hypothetical protein
MKVSELIAALQGCNQEVEVVFANYQNNGSVKYNNINAITELKNVFTPNPAIIGKVEIELTI